MNYAVIKPYDISNGPGVRVSLFVSGCTHRCRGCFNSEAWDFDYGLPYTPQTEDRIMQLLAPGYISGLSLLGGEPFEPSNQPALAALVRRTRETYPQKNVWCYTGYLFEDIAAGKVGDPDTAMSLLRGVDVLVDGPFVQELKDISLIFRGSANQRIIDVAESLRRGKATLYTV